MVTFSNAKLNIGLFVTGTRPDGYHNIESIFAPIALHDAIELTPAKENNITIYGRSIPGEITNNSCLKALKLMQERYNVQPYHINMIKRIPTGAGIGGGSSNATFTLKLINRLEELQLTTNELEELALQIGSDNPFFVENKTKYVTGRGETMTNCTMNLANTQVVLIYPSVHMSTAEAYKNVTFSSPAINLQSATKEDLFKQPQYFQNSFQPYFIQQNNFVQDIFTAIENSGANYSSLTGSGSCIFGLYEQDNNASFLQLKTFCNHNNYEFFETIILA